MEEKKRQKRGGSALVNGAVKKESACQAPPDLFFLKVVAKHSRNSSNAHRLNIFCFFRKTGNTIPVYFTRKTGPFTEWPSDGPFYSKYGPAFLLNYRTEPNELPLSVFQVLKTNKSIFDIEGNLRWTFNSINRNNWTFNDSISS